MPTRWAAGREGTGAVRNDSAPPPPPSGLSAGGGGWRSSCGRARGLRACVFVRSRACPCVGGGPELGTPPACLCAADVPYSGAARGGALSLACAPRGERVVPGAQLCWCCCVCPPLVSMRPAGRVATSAVVAAVRAAAALAFSKVCQLFKGHAKCALSGELGGAQDVRSASGKGSSPTLPHPNLPLGAGGGGMVLGLSWGGVRGALPASRGLTSTGFSFSALRAQGSRRPPIAPPSPRAAQCTAAADAAREKVYQSTPSSPGVG